MANSPGTRLFVELKRAPGVLGELALAVPLLHCIARYMGHLLSKESLLFEVDFSWMSFGAEDSFLATLPMEDFGVCAVHCLENLVLLRVLEILCLTSLFCLLGAWVVLRKLLVVLGQLLCLLFLFDLSDL